ncbi:MAG: CocE/NonD family hydrolase, partial [Candidatus Hydrogenedentota bacterium]
MAGNPRSVYFIALFLGFFALSAQAQQPAPADDLADYIKGHYTKYEYSISVRDGAKLFTSVYAPKDQSRKHAIMFVRTPYSVAPYGVDKFRTTLGPSEPFAREGFIFAYQDVRGRYMSDGTFQQTNPHVPNKGKLDVDESTDTYDTIDWLVKDLPNNNGKVGMWGISYPGFYVAAGMIDAHPALQVASPQAPVADFYRGDDLYHNGAFFLAASFGFFSAFREREEQEPPQPSLKFDYKTQDAYDFFLDMGSLSRANDLYFHGEHPYWNELIEHTTYDSFWRQRDIAQHLHGTPPAVLTVGGWFDAEDPMGPLNVYHSVEQKDRRTSNHLVMGPWFHGGWARGDGEGLGDVRFNSKTSVYYRENIEFPFFNYHLYGEGDGKFPDTWVFETGTNQWRTYDTWPPKTAKPKRLYFHADGKLSFDA